MREQDHHEVFRLELKAAALRLELPFDEAHYRFMRILDSEPEQPELDPYLSLGRGKAVPREHP